MPRRVGAKQPMGFLDLSLHRHLCRNAARSFHVKNCKLKLCSSVFEKPKCKALICNYSREGFWLRCGMGGGASWESSYIILY